MCQKDTYLKTCSATVLRCEKVPPVPQKKKSKSKPKDEYDVVLTDTVLFPEGGGQPYDVGAIGGAAVTRVENVDGIAVHRIASPLAVGAEVEVAVDWARRWAHATQHTAQHVASAVAEDWLGALTLSWHLGPTDATVELGAPFNAAEHVEELETRVNALIRASVDVETEWHAAGDVKKGRVRGMRASSCQLPASMTGPVRLCRIGDVDVNPCCGTHVRTLAHLQAFKILRIEKKKQSTLVYFVAGPRLLETLGACVEREKKCVEALCTAAETVPERVRDLVAKAKEAAQREKRLQKEVVDLLADRLAASTQSVVAAPLRPSTRDLGDVGKVLAAAFDLRRPDTVLVQTFGARGDGAFLISSAMPKLVDAARGPIMAALDGRGGGKGGRAQGKCAAIGNISTAVANAQKALAVAGLAFSGD
jgi:Ser-tRNA(Ala) deacylase AlaX